MIYFDYIEQTLICFILFSQRKVFGVKKETVAQVARDARASYKLQADDDGSDSSFSSAFEVVQPSGILSIAFESCCTYWCRSHINPNM